VKGRRAARRLALEALYESDIREESPTLAWARRLEAGEPVQEDDLDEETVTAVIAYAGSMVRVVEDRRAEIDALIERHAERWSLERMPVLDRSLARLAVAELLSGEVPIAVVVNEAVELAKELSTEDSPRFINGLLGRIAEVTSASGAD
jgi:N utilization substance protein B